VKLTEVYHEFLKQCKKCVQRITSAAVELAKDLHVEVGFQSVKKRI
jgi:hypothetical protein